MSDEEEEKPRRRRRPLSRSRKLGSRRRRGRGGGDEEENAEESGGEEAEGSGEPDAAPAAPAADESDHTVAVTKLPSPGGAGGSGTPNLDSVPAPPAAERMAKLKGSFRRFSSEFSKYLVGLGQEAHRSGVDFNQKVVKPFSHALFEAAICIAIIFVTGVFGIMFGSYLKTVTSKSSHTVSYQNRTVRPGQKIDQSFFSEGFDTKKLHQRASRILDEHLGALRDSDFEAAYDFLSPAWKEQLGFRTFESGYNSTKILAYEIGKVESLGPRRIRLRANLKVQEQGRERLYSAVYIAVLTNKGWRLDGGTFE